MIGRWLAATLLAAASPCGAAQWTAVPDASRLRFVASYEGQSAPGEFRRFQVQLERPAQGWPAARLRVSVDVASADMYSENVNAAIADGEWFDVAHHPRAQFESADIVRQDGQRLVARGTLRLKGVAREVAVPFTWRMREQNRAVMEGRLTLQRTAFDIGTGEWAEGDVIGMDVVVKFNVTLRQVR